MLISTLQKKLSEPDNGTSIIYISLQVAISSSVIAELTEFLPSFTTTVTISYVIYTTHSVQCLIVVLEYVLLCWCNVYTDGHVLHTVIAHN